MSSDSDIEIIGERTMSSDSDIEIIGESANVDHQQIKTKALAVTVTKNFGRRVQKIVSEQRRSSARLKSIPESKKPFYGNMKKRSFEPAEDDSIQGSSPNPKKKPKLNRSSEKSTENGKRIEVPSGKGDSPAKKSGNRDRTGKKKSRSSPDHHCSNGKSVTADTKMDDAGNTGPAVNAANGVDGAGKSAHARVKEAIRVFNTHFLQLVQEEENRCTKVDGEPMKGSKAKEKKCKKVETKAMKGSKSKKEDASEVDVKRSHKRPDLKAVSKMLESNEVLYPEKRFGSLPGVDVGHQFFSRAEMVAVGFHSHWLNGIDYMGQSYSKLKEYSGYTFPLAVAIVLSGQYEDDLDNSEDVVYTGQGGNDLLGNKHQIRDQVMRRGNLALKNNMEQSVPVRVIRGLECNNSYCGKVYTYDGLYKVVQYWAEKGVSGFTVFKYRLKRIEGQPALTTNQVQFVRGRLSKVPSELPGLVCKDICQGLEAKCIPATNLFDDPPVAPPDFIYTKSIQVAKDVKLPPDAPGCKCKGKCTNPKSCACARLNGDFPYVSLGGGRLIEAKDVVYECGPNCGCGPSCVNRTSQRELKYQLEVFRTPKKGWAVRSWDFIPSGAPVCEYTGVLKRNDELDHVSENDYIFEIDCWHTMNGLGGRERRSQDMSIPANNHLEKSDDNLSENIPESDFCIDAGSTGNVARFINHSCEPNLFVQCILSAHHDIRLARVVLFAADNIPPMQELTYDYGYALNSVVGPDGKIKELPCFCGAEGCRKRLY
ncbi:histone-lysine N-methyltransferase, H3 lysine-9 specific SUVH4-like [Malania oleifera]|uniref:histone-lysine N-methyltransferase, H3 lysine-9 specific SUVH4-like n=1 Tax=Malania oleifera TaxID=397392 RepID=UPI0025AE1BD4|nr:histone-lysine N-methyltransferase, H3 lysine-9 specific SUVH4-like [Malania oleifera]